MGFLNRLFGSRKHEEYNEADNNIVNFDEVVEKEHSVDNADILENEIYPEEELFNASESELNSIKTNMENTQKTLMQEINDEINEFCSKNMENKGYQDCINNSDMLNKEKSMELITTNFRNIITKSIDKIKERLVVYDDKIKEYETAVMTESASKFKNKVDVYTDFKLEIEGYLKDEKKLKEKIHYPLLSYEIGFNNALKASDNKLI